MRHDLDKWTNSTLAVRRYLHVCRRCCAELIPGIDSSQFCRRHQDEQNAVNRAYNKRKRGAR